MYTTNKTASNISSILNQNRIQDGERKEAIIAMGLSICQVGCMGGGQYYRYHKSAH